MRKRRLPTLPPTFIRTDQYLPRTREEAFALYQTGYLSEDVARAIIGPEWDDRSEQAAVLSAALNPSDSRSVSP